MKNNNYVATIVYVYKGDFIVMKTKLKGVCFAFFCSSFTDELVVLRSGLT